MLREVLPGHIYLLRGGGGDRGKGDHPRLFFFTELAVVFLHRNILFLNCVTVISNKNCWRLEQISRKALFLGIVCRCLSHVRPIQYLLYLAHACV